MKIVFSENRNDKKVRSFLTNKIQVLIHTPQPSTSPLKGKKSGSGVFSLFIED